MSCKHCQSDHHRSFDAEIAIHFPGFQGLNKQVVWLFPKIAVCLSCGFTEFSVPETELRQLAEVDSASG